MRVHAIKNKKMYLEIADILENSCLHKKNKSNVKWTSLVEF